MPKNELSYLLRKPKIGFSHKSGIAAIMEPVGEVNKKKILEVNDLDLISRINNQDIKLDQLRFSSKTLLYKCHLVYLYTCDDLTAKFAIKGFKDSSNIIKNVISEVLNVVSFEKSGGEIIYE